jgi:hypothetical protein
MVELSENAAGTALLSDNGQDTLNQMVGVMILGITPGKYTILQRDRGSLSHQFWVKGSKMIVFTILMMASTIKHAGASIMAQDGYIWRWSHGVCSFLYTDPEYSGHATTIIGTGGSILMEFIDAWTTEHFDKMVTAHGHDDLAVNGNPCQVFTYRYADDKSAEKAWDCWEQAEVHANTRGDSFLMEVADGIWMLVDLTSRLERVLRRWQLDWSNSREAIEALPHAKTSWSVGSGDSILCKSHPETCVATLKALLAAQFSHQVGKQEVADFLPAADFVFLKDRSVRCIMISELQ